MNIGTLYHVYSYHTGQIGDKLMEKPMALFRPGILLVFILLEGRDIRNQQKFISDWSQFNLCWNFSILMEVVSSWKTPPPSTGHESTLNRLMSMKNPKRYSLHNHQICGDVQEILEQSVRQCSLLAPSKQQFREYLLKEWRSFLQFSFRDL